MNANAFERFETSKSGLLIPLAVFVVGALVTVVAVSAVERVAQLDWENRQQRFRQADKEMVAPDQDSDQQKVTPEGSQADSTQESSTAVSGDEQSAADSQPTSQGQSLP